MTTLTKKDSRSLLVGVCWGAGVTCLCMLINFSFPERVVIASVVVGAAAFTAAFYLHGWFSAKGGIERLKGLLFVIVIWGGTTALGCIVYPKVEITPTDIHFHNIIGPGEAYPVTLTNHKSHDVFIVSFEMDAGSTKGTEFALHVPHESLKPLNQIAGQKAPTMADVSMVNCPGEGGRFSYVTVYRMRPNESREFEIRHDVAGSADVKFDLYKYYSEPMPKYVTPTGVGSEFELPNSADCNGIQMQWIDLPTEHQ